MSTQSFKKIPKTLLKFNREWKYGADRWTYKRALEWYTSNIIANHYHVARYKNNIFIRNISCILSFIFISKIWISAACTYSHSATDPTIYSSSVWFITLKAPSKICSRRQSKLFLFRENKSWHFMWIVCLADDSHELSRLISFKNNFKETFQNVVCCSCDWHFKGCGLHVRTELWVCFGHFRQTTF